MSMPAQHTQCQPHSWTNAYSSSSCAVVQYEHRCIIAVQKSLYYSDPWFDYSNESFEYKYENVLLRFTSAYNIVAFDKRVNIDAIFVRCGGHKATPVV